MKLYVYRIMGPVCRERALRELGYRLLVCGRYICVYRQIADTIFVYHIVDARANYPRLLRALVKDENGERPS